MNKNMFKKNTVWVIIPIGFIIVSFLFFAKKQKSTTEPMISNIITEKETAKQDIEIYHKVYKEPAVIFLRKALDSYLSANSKEMNISQTAVEKQTSEGIISGLDAFDKEYYKSKFVVLTINDSLAGGKDIQLIFQNKPDRIFYAWVYKPQNDEFELRAFNSKETLDPSRMNQLNEEFKELLFDKEYSI